MRRLLLVFAAVFLTGWSHGDGRLPLDSRIVVLGNSISALSFTKQPRQWGYFGSGSRVYQVAAGNLSLPGDDYSQMLVRLPNAVAAAPKIIQVSPPINDIIGSRTLAAIMSDADAMIAGAASVGSLIVFDLCPITSGMTAPQLVNRTAVNAALVSRQSATVFTVDVPSVYNGNDSSKSYDGVHPNEVGSASPNWGAVRGNLYQTLLTPNTVIGDGGELAGNQNTNWDMAGTSGSSTSCSSGAGPVVATGWSIANASGATCEATKTTQNGRTAQRIKLSASASSTGLVTLQHTVTASRNEGQFVEQFAEVSITAADGTSAPLGLNAFGITAGGTFLSSTPDSNSGPWASGAFSGVVRTVPTVVTSPQSGTGITIGMSAVVGSVDIVLTVSWTPQRLAETVAYAAPYYQGITAINTVAAVTGTLTVGSTLTCGPGIWSGGGIAITYQWKMDGTNVGGATSRTYVVQAGDSGKTASCAVTATNSISSATTTPVASGPIS